MLVYWSDFVGAGTTLNPLRDRAGVGSHGGILDLRADPTSLTGRCLVGSSVPLPTPTGVTFLLDTSTDLGSPLPANVRTFINSQLGITVPTGLTWLRLFRRLFTIDGAGRWGTLIGSLRLRFGSAGDIDISAP